MTPETSTWKEWGVENKELLSDVLTTIQRDGPLSTRAFERPEGMERSPWAWFGGKPAKMALDFLWTRGDLVVLRRNGFERFYELTERAFPELGEARLPEPDDEIAFFADRALTALGVTTAVWAADYFRPGTRRYVHAKDVALRLDTLVEQGRAFRVRIEGQNQPAWLDSTLIPDLTAFRNGQVAPRRRTLLTPFDNLLWRRVRALELFGFDYLLESYTPETKRIYGYHTLPILIDGALVGRLDPRFKRKEGLLLIPALHLEPSVKMTAALADGIAEAIKGLTMFLGGTAVLIEEANPARIGEMVQRRLKSIPRSKR